MMLPKARLQSVLTLCMGRSRLPKVVHIGHSLQYVASMQSFRPLTPLSAQFKLPNLSHVNRYSTHSIALMLE